MPQTTSQQKQALKFKSDTPASHKHTSKHYKVDMNDFAKDKDKNPEYYEIESILERIDRLKKKVADNHKRIDRLKKKVADNHKPVGVPVELRTIYENNKRTLRLLNSVKFKRIGKIDEETRERMVFLYRGGILIAELIKLFGINEKEVQTILAISSDDYEQVSNSRRGYFRREKKKGKSNDK